MRDQLKIFFTAMMFLTRIPCPSWVDHAPDSLAKSTVYFPLIGVLVGGIGALVYRLIACAYSPNFAALCGIATTVIITGAFHEDALADVCDGFGGWTAQRRLEIMRDSRVGSFGVAGLVLLIGAKATLLGGMPISRAVAAFLAAHAVARWSSLIMIVRFPYVTDSDSLARPFAGAITPTRLLFGTLLAAATAALCSPATAIALFAITLLLCQGAGTFFRKWVGGISGDCIGAVNQLTELLCYAVIVQSSLLESATRHLLHL
jgi:adenosylcobinamide-GDP ribazoletransferase